MTAAARLAALDSLPADDLCQMAEVALAALVDIMNQKPCCCAPAISSRPAR
ncbi:hypothetical protein N8D56_13955 [Devosia sp. A8/3-2]|nr:hypothetical protein N8D56_13955 [Devosia sp. A8/3-2]